MRGKMRKFQRQKNLDFRILVAMQKNINNCFSCQIFFYLLYVCASYIYIRIKSIFSTMFFLWILQEKNYIFISGQVVQNLDFLPKN